MLDALQILGTFITEWQAGSILCELLLWTEQSAETAAVQLANIALFYGFDGWLLNIENPILHRHVPNLVHFIRYSHILLLPAPLLPPPLYNKGNILPRPQGELGFHVSCCQVTL